MMLFYRTGLARFDKCPAADSDKSLEPIPVKSGIGPLARRFCPNLTRKRPTRGKRPNAFPKARTSSSAFIRGSTTFQYHRCMARPRMRTGCF